MEKSGTLGAGGEAASGAGVSPAVTAGAWNCGTAVAVEAASGRVSDTASAMQPAENRPKARPSPTFSSRDPEERSGTGRGTRVRSFATLTGRTIFLARGVGGPKWRRSSWLCSKPFVM